MNGNHYVQTPSESIIVIISRGWPEVRRYMYILHIKRRNGTGT